MSEFELHVRAIAGLPIGSIDLIKPGASAVILAPETGESPQTTGLDRALRIPETKLRIFGKLTCYKNRRMGVALATGETIDQARERAKDCAAEVKILI
jgi:phosphoribosylglycinamide formyltransferase 2